MAPIALATRQRPAIAHQIIATGQQGLLFDRAMNDFDIKVDRYLGIETKDSETALDVETIRSSLSELFASNRPDLVLVQGDTNSAYAAALAAHDKGIAIGHIEAGLRTHIPDRPWPEERNRVAIGQMAALHFAPSRQAMQNLECEQVPGTAFLTGNPGIDALMMITQPAQPAKNSPHQILVTCHRRENFGAPLLGICQALRMIAAWGEALITLPLHPNPEVRLTLIEQLKDVPRINLIEPLDYSAMVAAIQASYMVISDSGGLQEECAALGIPLILMRDETERPEVVINGNCVLSGASPTKIIAEASRLLEDEAHHARMSIPFLPYGDGTAASRILDIIEHFA